MSYSLTSPVTGQAITGLTSPTFTLVLDGATPDGVSRGWYVSALGGTQTGVTAHSIASPFTTSWKNPANLLVPGVVDVTGVYRAPPRFNKYKCITRKGAVPLSGQAARTNVMETTFSIEAGTETADPQQIRAQLSLHIGSLTQQVNGIIDTLISGSP